MVYVTSDRCPKFPPALRGVLGVKSLALGRHLVHRLSLQKFHRCQVAQCCMCSAQVEILLPFFTRFAGIAQCDK